MRLHPVVILTVLSAFGLACSRAGATPALTVESPLQPPVATILPLGSSDEEDAIATTVPEPLPTVSPATASTIGATTRALFHLQSSEQAGGKILPMLGITTTPALNRYLQSFTHPIPEFFDENVKKSSD